MKSFTTLSNLFNSLSQNTTSTNTALGKQLINDRHRYLIQKYFDNLQTGTALTIAADDYTTTGALSSGATSATLTATWMSATVYQQVTFSNSDIRTVLFTYNSTSITWSLPLSSSATTAISSSGVQAYPLPANVSKIKDVTVTVGQLKFLPVPILTQADWDNINFLPYTSDIPQYYFVFNNTIQIFPIPSTSNNVITYTYKRRVVDMTYADYTTGTIAYTAGLPTVTGTGTSWTGTFTTSENLTTFNIMLSATALTGDGIWYPCMNITSATALNLTTPINSIAPFAGTSYSGLSYTLGQFPLLQEDFHDMIVYGALMTYFSSIVDNKSKFDRFKAEYTDRLALLEDYAGTRQVNVDLGSVPNPVNPNLFIYAQS